MARAGLAWEQRLVQELATGRDLLCLDVLGTQFIVRWGRAITRQQRERISSVWARCASSREPVLPPLPKEPAQGQRFTASVAYQSQTHDDGTFHVQAASFEELAEIVTSRITVAAILSNAGDMTMLHACGLAEPATGAVVALVAKSGTGKTTAASVLAKTYGYITDETVAIGPDGSVIPYPKPLSLKQGPGSPKHQAGPDALGLRPAPARPFLQSIVLLDRRPGDGPAAPVLAKLPLADALLTLIPETSSQAEIGQPLQSLCRLIGSVGGVWRVTYSEAADLPAALEPLFRMQIRMQGRLEPGWETSSTDADHTGHIPDGCIRRAAYRDAVTLAGGDLLVMLDTEIVRLSGIGPAIWAASAGPVTADHIADEVGKAHGKPEGYRDAVAAAITQLSDKSVLELGRM